MRPAKWNRRIGAHVHCTLKSKGVSELNQASKCHGTASNHSEKKQMQPVTVFTYWWSKGELTAVALLERQVHVHGRTPLLARESECHHCQTKSK
jgi:hypothetical protein